MPIITRKTAMRWLAIIILGCAVSPLTSSHAADDTVRLVDIVVERFDPKDKTFKPLKIEDDKANPATTTSNVQHDFKTGDRFRIRVFTHRQVYLCVGNAAPRINQPKQPAGFTSIFPEAPKTGSASLVLIPAGKEHILPVDKGLWKFVAPANNEFMKFICIERKPNRSISSDLFTYEDGDNCSEDDAASQSAISAPTIPPALTPYLFSITRSKESDPKSVSTRLLLFRHTAPAPQ